MRKWLGFVWSLLCLFLMRVKVGEMETEMETEMDRNRFQDYQTSPYGDIFAPEPCSPPPDSVEIVLSSLLFFSLKIRVFFVYFFQSRFIFAFGFLSEFILIRLNWILIDFFFSVCSSGLKDYSIFPSPQPAQVKSLSLWYFFFSDFGIVCLLFWAKGLYHHCH